MRRAAASVALASLKRNLTFIVYPVAGDITMWDAEVQASPGRVRMFVTSPGCMEARKRARTEVRAPKRV